MVSRLRELPTELRNAGIAAAVLALTLFLPWYTQSYVPEGSREFVKRNVSAFGVFSFVEAAVLLVAAAVMFLIWARSERKGFHLPGGDGTAIMLAGGWAVLLLVWRLFDKPDAPNPSEDYGLQWGIAAALAAAVALFVMGLRVRAVDRPEPPNPAAEEPEPPPREPRPRVDSTAVTEVLGERPDWSGEPPEPPGRARPSQPRPPSEEPTEKMDDNRLF
jgi:amino acid transporter